MLLALRLAFSRWRSRGSVAPASGVESSSSRTSSGRNDGSPDAAAADHADALWRSARDEASPFRRDALYLELATHLVEAAGPELLRFCERHVADPTVAEDVAQRAVLELWRVLPRFEGRSTIRTFLFGIALNLCRREVRTETREHRRFDRHEDRIRDEVHPDQLPELDEDAEHRARVAALERTLAMMEPREAWLLRARLVDELSYAEILPRYQARFGAHITTPEGLRTAFFHAKKRLEAMLRGTR